MMEEWAPEVVEVDIETVAEVGLAVEAGFGVEAGPVIEAELERLAELRGRLGALEQLEPAE